MKPPVIIKKSDGSQELFDQQKLVDSLSNAGASDDIISKIVVHVQKAVHDNMSTADIYEHAFRFLREHSLPIAIKYSLRRALSELGPDGFPFEKYVARIFQARGYETLTDQTIFGGCISHEIDVIAWTKEKLVMVEAKFHNEFLLKSDVKVVMYIKARFDDIKDNMYNYGGVERKLDQGWLVTNTKFTEQAIKYGECQGMKLIGWNYPEKGNLQDIIEELRLHPFTCLVSLSNVQKKNLLLKGVILCRDLIEHPDFFKEIGMSIEDEAKVLEEAKKVCGIA